MPEIDERRKIDVFVFDLAQCNCCILLLAYYIENSVYMCVLYASFQYKYAARLIFIQLSSKVSVFLVLCIIIFVFLFHPQNIYAVCTSFSFLSIQFQHLRVFSLSLFFISFSFFIFRFLLLCWTFNCLGVVSPFSKCF